MTDYARPKANQAADDLADFVDPVAEFDQAVRTAMERSPSLSRQAAVVAVAKQNLRLHQAYLLATNPGRRQRRLLLEKISDLEDAGK